MACTHAEAPLLVEKPPRRRSCVLALWRWPRPVTIARNGLFGINAVRVDARRRPARSSSSWHQVPTRPVDLARGAPGDDRGLTRTLATHASLQAAHAPHERLAARDRPPTLGNNLSDFGCMCAAGAAPIPGIGQQLFDGTRPDAMRHGAPPRHSRAGVRATPYGDREIASLSRRRPGKPLPTMRQA